ncbi:hypothetical protein OSTOST_16054, partial [Ostertagia ostertagi]
MANHYMDIKTLAEASRKDEWEISLSNLIIHESEVLGNGAFAVVHKATLKGKDSHLLVVNPRLNLVSEHEQENGTCEAAVKRLPTHANDQNRMEFFQEINFHEESWLSRPCDQNIANMDLRSDYELAAIALSSRFLEIMRMMFKWLAFSPYVGLCLLPGNPDDPCRVLCTWRFVAIPAESSRAHSH